MAFKFVAMVALLAVANAGVIPVQQTTHEQYEHPGYHQQVPAQQLVLTGHGSHVTKHEEYADDPHPKYNFAYQVEDAVSGDSKSQVETRDGDVVRGEYTVVDADGFKRTVKYTADDVNGFNAVVSREPIHGYQKVVEKHVAQPAPSYEIHSAPAQYHHAPQAAIVKATPVAYVAPTLRKTQVTYSQQQQPQQQQQNYETPINHHAHPEQLQQHQEQQQYQHEQLQQQQQQHHHQYATYESEQYENHDGY
ncbi:cuticle protein-like [Musca autumnalis]|uniref:cuticle protein-like n=1 Tax=Musca autumnalis TaxID=221902 RepID=UPI003CF0ADE9